jgi:hypothetical protein
MDIAYVLMVACLLAVALALVAGCAALETEK